MPHLSLLNQPRISVLNENSKMATKEDEQSIEENGNASTNNYRKSNRKRNVEKQDESAEKQQKQDGFSWWTCLLLDIPQSNKTGMRIPVFHKEE